MVSLLAKSSLVKIGDEVERLTVIGHTFRIRNGDPQHPKYFNVCECKCGNVVAVRTQDLAKGTRLSCGCKWREGSKPTHGRSKHPLYHTWKSMKRRCYVPSNDNYANYGARGIAVCDEWRESVDTFIVWSEANGWSQGLQIDRINNNGNYEPDNCRFVRPKANANNRGCSKFVTAFGETKTVAQWFEDDRCVVAYPTLSKRFAKGWEPEKAIVAPQGKRQAVKMTADKAREVVRLYRDGWQRRDLRQRFNVSRALIDQVLAGHIWNEATGVDKCGCPKCIARRAAQ